MIFVRRFIRTRPRPCQTQDARGGNITRLSDTPGAARPGRPLHAGARGYLGMGLGLVRTGTVQPARRDATRTETPARLTRTSWVLAAASGGNQEGSGMLPLLLRRAPGAGAGGPGGHWPRSGRSRASGAQVARLCLATSDADWNLHLGRRQRRQMPRPGRAPSAARREIRAYKGGGGRHYTPLEQLTGNDRDQNGSKVIKGEDQPSE